jgi:hypothetical protein
MDLLLTAAGDEEDRRGWPIHAKQVPPIDLDALAALPGVPESKTAANWQAKRRWLEDDELYTAHGVPLRSSARMPKANYREEWMRRLVDTGVVCPVRRGSVRGWARMYGVPEPAKERFRAIMHTVDINDACNADTIDHPRFPTKLTIAEAVHNGDWMIALDFSAYYYQFGLDEKVGSSMCFKWNHRCFRLMKLAMGQRQAVDVANAATARLLDFPQKSRRVMSIIDNVIFIGSRDAVTDDAWEFVQRCKQVNATLNEIDVRAATRSGVAALTRQNGDWGGVHIDLADKTASLTKKIVDKTRRSWENRAHWHWRHYAAHIGLLFWAWGIVELPMASFFPALRFNSEVGKMATNSLAEVQRALGLPPDSTPPNPFWNKPAAIWDSVMPVLERWTQMVLQNKPRVVKAPQQHDILLECDASKWGWSCYGVHLATSETFAFSEQWSAEMRRRYGEKLGESTLTEPFGVLFSLERARERFSDAKRFAITNDNTVAVLTHQRGFNSRSHAINECMRQREDRFPQSDYTITTKHVAGVNNVADAGSRGRGVGEVDGDVLRSRWGTTERAAEVNSRRE